MVYRSFKEIMAGKKIIIVSNPSCIAAMWFYHIFKALECISHNVRRSLKSRDFPDVLFFLLLFLLGQMSCKFKKQQFITWKPEWLMTCSRASLPAHLPLCQQHFSFFKQISKNIFIATFLPNDTQRKCVVRPCKTNSWPLLTTKQKKKLILATSVMVSLPTVRNMASWSLAAG